MSLITLKSVLVVEDDRALGASLARVVESWGPTVSLAFSVSDAIEALQACPDLLLVDLQLEDEKAFSVIDRANRMRPAPRIVAMSGRATPEDAFRLGQLGVARYVPKPIDADELRRAVDEALSESPDLEPLAVAVVGKQSLRDAQQTVRSAMVSQALAKEGGNRSRAARALRVSRQAVQQIVGQEGWESPPTPPRTPPKEEPPQ